ncbi:MAG: aminopeptidase [Oscillospiraceae bacterium]|jgi:aspartyl aminopeptidase|nr:aminopeptidase [Oscillospiraceae bacterium]
MSEEKTLAQKLEEKLLYKPKNLGQTRSEEEIKAAFDFCENYKAFLDASKTERETVTYAINRLKAEGFAEFEAGKKYSAGDKIYYNNRGKALIAAVIGKKSLEEGTRLTAAHTDCPRLDLKPRPLYEDTELALFKTHYYGGIKKYQWTATPLALHGVICRQDGTSAIVNIGEDAGDPVFCVTDLLPHLAKEQAALPIGKAIKGENLNLLVGSLPFKDDKASNLVKLNILKLLNEKYGVVEADFVRAELELVPAVKAADVGFDRSLIGAYGHDDRSCAYTSFMAFIECKEPEYTAALILADKEETGSNSSTGLDTSFFRYFYEDLALSAGVNPRAVFSKSKCLSADVTAGLDPTYPEVHDKHNAALLNYGVCLAKYTGSGGKYSTNDASAEFVAEITNLLDGEGVQWQMDELGVIDLGGGGTVAIYLAALDIDTLDIGIPVLSMHSPFELVSKLDTYETYRAFKAFYK